MSATKATNISASAKTIIGYCTGKARHNLLFEALDAAPPRKRQKETAPAVDAAAANLIGSFLPVRAWGTQNRKQGTELLSGLPGSTAKGTVPTARGASWSRAEFFLRRRAAAVF
jgi:hypothetical protein